MTPEVAYFLKVNVAIALFYAFYRLFFHRDTFLQWRRAALLGFLAVSLLHPLLNLETWVKNSEPMTAMADLYAAYVLPEFSTASAVPATVDWNARLLTLSAIIYISGVSLFVLRMLIQLASLVRLHFRCAKSTVAGVRVHLLKSPLGPFSFFRWIFVNPYEHTDGELNEILIHEQTHVRQWHSIDVIVAELMCIGCWFNPFVWLVKREIRNNLEYLADRNVIESGYDSKSYQYHLLALAHQKAIANLSNNFKVLPIKNRIYMMNKRKTKQIGRSKYLLFLPLATLLLTVSNIEAVARATRAWAEETMPVLTGGVLPQPEVQMAESDTIPPPPPPRQKNASKKETVSPPPPLTDSKQKPMKTAAGDQVFEVVEDMPEFPGGQSELMSFLAKNVKYPVEAHEIQGRVIVSFVVRKDGSISDAEVVRSVAPSLDQEALRVINSMPKWKPGKQRGQNVNVKYVVPLIFRLEGGDKKPVQDEGAGSDPVKAAAGDRVFEVVDEMPRFPGGQSGLMDFLTKNVKYPAGASTEKEGSRVITSFVVRKDGSVTDAKIVRGVDPLIDAEALRVIGLMPKWEPGRQRGQAVDVKYTLPFIFRK